MGVGTGVGVEIIVIEGVTVSDGRGVKEGNCVCEGAIVAVFISVAEKTGYTVSVSGSGAGLNPLLLNQSATARVDIRTTTSVPIRKIWKRL